jgi:hypothetical protein
MAARLSSRERLARVFRGEPVDRVPIRLWGAGTGRADNPAWQPLNDLVDQYELDLISEWNPAWALWPDFHLTHREIGDAEWYEELGVIDTPAGPLSYIFLLNHLGKPGYMKKHPIETVEDARRWLSLPMQPMPPTETYAQRVAETGDRGITMTVLYEPAGVINHAMGSELWGIWLYEERELLHALVSQAAERVTALTDHLIAQGVRGYFGWAGPEMCIPPLASPTDFTDFVVRYDQPLIARIHDADGQCWVHCHGDMEPVLEGFADMGVDCLQPIEPPPIGKLTLAEVKRRVGARMTLEGGVQSGDFELHSPDEVAATVETVMAMGKPGGRFILGPSSSQQQWPDLSPQIAHNYRVFVETALRCADY